MLFPGDWRHTVWGHVNLSSRLKFTDHPTNISWGCKSILGLASGSMLLEFPAYCGEGFLYDHSLCTLTLSVPLAQGSQQNNSSNWPESEKMTFLLGLSVRLSVFLPFCSGNSVPCGYTSLPAFFVVFKGRIDLSNLA